MEVTLLDRLKELNGFEFCLWSYVVYSAESGAFRQKNKEIAEFFKKTPMAISANVKRIAKKGFFEVYYGYRGSRTIIAK